MPEAYLTLLKGDKIGSETDYRDYLPVNMSAVVRPILNASGYMIQQSGLTLHATGEGIDRGGVWNQRALKHYRVSGRSLIEVDKNGIITVLGDIAGANTAVMPYSFNTQAIVTAGRYWLYEPVNGLKEITDTDLGNPIDCIWTDQYYFFTDGEFLFHTDVNDETQIDPLKFATAEFMPDKSLGLGRTADNLVIVFGRETTQYFRNAATDNFAFAFVQSRTIKAGIVGTHCKAEIKEKWYILGGGKDESISVHVLGVGAVTPVASREVEKLIAQYTEEQLKDVVLETRTEKAYSYLIVHLPNETLQLNVTLLPQVGVEQAWSIIKTGTDNDEWRAKFGVFDAGLGQWVYGDKLGSNIGLLDETVATQYGEIAEWFLNTPFYDLETMSIDEISIETIPGWTTEKDATVALSLTYDGVTHTTEHWINYGLPSKYGTNFKTYALGYVDDWAAIRLRGASRSRMAFATVSMVYS